MSWHPRLAASLLALSILGASPAAAHPSELHVSPEYTGTLEQLLALFAPSPAMAQEFTGPTKPVGISAKTLGQADLTGELPGLENRLLRARLWTMEPDGIVPVHDHTDRPAYVYVLEGEVTEHRSDDPEPRIYKAGDLSVEAEGVVHWWQNTGGTTVRLLAIDLMHQQ